MIKKTFLSVASSVALLGANAAPAFASSKFFLVVPLKAQGQVQEPAEAITVSLAGAALPKATVNQAYSESLRPYLSVTGDAAFDPAAASWSLAEGALPEGLALDGNTGAVAGTPMEKTTSSASFTVRTSYKGQDGQAVYTIEVGGNVFQVSSISAGYGHTCAITVEGGVKCWGQNNYGQLGDISTAQRSIPVDVVGLTSGVASVSTGSNHTCAVTTGGGVKCWGYNGHGQLGDNSTTDRIAPVDVSGLASGVASVSAGENHTCAVTTAGGLKCWGLNNYGQLGDNSKTSRLTPVSVAGLLNEVASVEAGTFHTCAVTRAGGAKCWGHNGTGQLGDNSTTARLIPVNVVGLTSGVTSVAAGTHHTCAVMAGAVMCWGYNSYGQLGDNRTTHRSTPGTVLGLTSGIANVSAGGLHTCAVTIGGAAKCWGSNGNGQLGDNTTTSRLTSVDVFGLNSGVVSITAGDRHTCAVTTGAAKCWGYNGRGQLGNNSTIDSSVPVDVKNLP